MTYPTVWQLFEVRDHIINHINTFKSQFAVALQNAQATLIESNHLTLDNKLKPIKETLDILNEVRSNSRKLDLILQRISEVESKINDQTTSNIDDHLSKTLTSIETRLQELHVKLIANPTNNQAGPSSSLTKPSSADTHSAHSSLPIFQANHPTARCRSYGYVEFNGLSLHIPMDVRGRRSSTALRLITKHTLSSDATTVEYELLDDDALLLTEEIITPHKLDRPFGDSLALLHSKCPNFIYKIRDDGLC